MDNINIRIISEGKALVGGQRIPSISSALDILCFSHLRWDFVTQRPQHLLRQAAKDRRIFYWEEPVWHSAEDLAREGKSEAMWLESVRPESQICVLTPHLRWGVDFATGMKALLDNYIADMKVTEFMLWYYTPMAIGFSGHLAPSLTIYDCMDELGNFAGAPADLRENEQLLLRAADIVFTGGQSLYEEKRKHHPAVYAFPSSVDVAHFDQAKRISTLPTDEACLPEPRVGFYGVLDERLDLTLLQSIARLRPKMQFVLLGPVVKIDPETLPMAANLHYLGRKSYEELPAYVAGWSAAMLPFAINAATQFISPTKTPEYLAAGRSVVSTPIRDVIRDYGADGVVAIAATAEEFALALDFAVLPQTGSWRRAVVDKLDKSSWGKTWEQMERIIGSKLRDKLVAISSVGMDEIHGLNMGTEGQSPRTNGPVPKRTNENYDYLVVGAGFAGSVLAERLASQMGKRVLLIDKREHIAGNAYDFYNKDGILIHQYGPHIFHTNSESVVTYLSQFTGWRPYEHRVLSQVDGLFLPVPINLTTINKLYNLQLDAEGMKAFLAARVIAKGVIRTSEDIVVSRVGRELYEKFFRNYTRKQWGLDPADLDAGVAGRIPVRYSEDDRYFTDTFQAMPLEGYTRMFERMLDHKKIMVRTGVEFADVKRSYPQARVIYTGPIDEFFSYRFGPLPYRSLEFCHETHDVEQFQAAPVVNYPNEHDYTRVTEFKYLTGQQHRKTSIVYEYPKSKGDPYYPIPRPENALIYEKYKELGAQCESVDFCGRLANYRYFNMDQVVAQALALFQRIADRETRIAMKIPLLGSVARGEESKSA